MENRVGAFFDFDETLLMAESATLGLQHLIEQGVLSWRQVAPILISYLLYRLGFVTEGDLLQKAVGYYAGERVETVRERAIIFYKQVLKPRLAPGILQRLSHHQQEGHFTAIVSASEHYLLAPAREDLGFDKLLTTRLEETAEGTFTGQLASPLLIFEEKAKVIRRLAEDHSLDLSRSYAYGNSRFDIPMLESVGYPHAVRPDRRLARLCKERGWPVLDYGG